MKPEKMFEQKFQGELWKHQGGWCFITLPEGTSKKIRKSFADEEEGWGRLKTTATIGSTIWKTSIWFDKKANAYLLPVKLVIRKKEGLAIGTKISGKLEFA